MKEDMYTYHYYKNRSIVKNDRTSDYIMQVILLCAAALAAMLLTHLH